MLYYVYKMFNILLLALITYVFTSLLGYIVHWAIHQRWMGDAYSAHQSHHLIQYPPNKLISDEYRSAGAFSTVYIFLVIFSPLLLTPIVLCLFGLLTFMQAVTMLSTMSLVGILNDRIHDSFHVKNHWMSRYIPWYDWMRQLHFVHHVNMKCNFGIYEFVWDRIFRTHKR